MSQIVPPPMPDHSSSPPDYSPAEPATALAVLDASPPAYIYEAEQPRRTSRFWRVVKWPMRKLLKSLYLLGRTASRHKAIALVTLLLLVAIAAGGVIAYRTANPEPSIPIANASRPAIPASVHHWLHGFISFNAREMWDSLSPQMKSTLEQANSGETALQGVLNQDKAGHVTVEYRYVGGYQTSQGNSYYVVQVNLRGDQGVAALTWYFVVDDTSGQISLWRDISPQSPSSSSGSSTQGG
jgi:hypothetical protein